MKFEVAKLGVKFGPSLLKAHHCKAADRTQVTTLLFNQWWQYGRAFFRNIFARKPPKSVNGFKGVQVGNPSVIEKSSGKSLSWKDVFSRVVSKCGSDTLAAELRRNTAKSLMFGTGNTFALLGFALAKEPSLLTQKEELEVICQEIREAFHSQPAKESNTNFSGPISLAHLNLGSMLAKGCNAAVFSATWKSGVTADDSDGDSGEILPSGSFGPLAVKMMFNYTAESNATAIWRSMYRESVPAQKQSLMEGSMSFSKFQLPPHPNIVEMMCAFADRVPSLPEGPERFPSALPVRLHDQGLGRNMTYFLVMRRYDCSLREYLGTHTPSNHTSMLLMAQLMEGLLHLHNYRVAHRDLKSDNLLINLTYGKENPHLVITDFGCCLAENTFEVVYSNDDVFRGGNMALMAPEVITARPGRSSVINFQKSDIWAAGTIVYEIFGGKNPFYEGTPFHLNNFDYQNEDVPPLPPHSPKAMQKVVKGMLARNPQERLSVSELADICQVLLHAPVGLPVHPKEVLLWLVALLELSFYHQEEPEDILEQQLRINFLSRVQLQTTLDALTYIND